MSLVSPTHSILLHRFGFGYFCLLLPLDRRFSSYPTFGPHAAVNHVIPPDERRISFSPFHQKMCGVCLSPRVELDQNFGYRGRAINQTSLPPVMGGTADMTDNSFFLILCSVLALDDQFFK
jgi:hypothetical protein